jgi:septum formation protein
MFKNLNAYQIILASNSPRRQELLRSIGLNFETKSFGGEETYPHDLPPLEVAEFLAIQKANWFDIINDQDLLITADTVVITDNTVLGKPKDKQEAVGMIQTLSGKTHQVITGVCLKSKHKTVSFHSITQVTFKNLSEHTIHHYIDTYQPFDKAGSYGIQEWIGMIGISGIKGSYFNVMGLPTDMLFDALENF